MRGMPLGGSDSDSPALSRLRPPPRLARARRRRMVLFVSIRLGSEAPRQGDFNDTKDDLLSIKAVTEKQQQEVPIQIFKAKFTLSSAASKTMRFFRICRASQSSILCHLRNLQLLHHIHKVPVTPHACMSLFVQLELS